MMANDCNDKLSIKNLLFSKAIPNYVIPISTEGHKVYLCTDCGDRFIFESSYEHHVNRKSVKITYICRHCNQVTTFKNRCNLLSHIRSHAFKTATINVSDLKIEPLPLSSFQIKDKIKGKETLNLQTSLTENQQKQTLNKGVCIECKTDFTVTGTIYKDRAKHLMQYTNEVHTCPVCLFTLPTSCGLKTHLRLHLKSPPYYCPECGIHLSNKSINYPYSHDCEGFKMMRATARYKCPVADCHHFHPSEYKEHMKYKHLKKVYKCPICVVACFNETTIDKHLNGHKIKEHSKDNKADTKALIFYQCELCPSRLVLQNQMNNHLKAHLNNFAYPCWVCTSVFDNVLSLISHHTSKHNQLLTPILNNTVFQNENPKDMYRVVKRCDKCRRSFTYKCKYDQILVLPNECPYKCSTTDHTQSHTQTLPIDTTAQIICHMCKIKMSQNWEEIKKHYAAHHKSIRCLDIKLVLTKLDIKKYKGNRTPNHKHVTKINKKKVTRKNKRNLQKIDLVVNSESTTQSIANNWKEFDCKKCGHSCENKELLETHMLCHRDPCMAYQCMECGQCFVVKPSFSTHLFLEHGISNIENYINDKQCYNAGALIKRQHDTYSTDEPLHENQCKICREQFQDCNDLEKHFRVHGMAFLMKNTSNKNVSP